MKVLTLKDIPNIPWKAPSRSKGTQAQFPDRVKPSFSPGTPAPITAAW
jgi:hypothetical protein